MASVFVNQSTAIDMDYFGISALAWSAITQSSGTSITASYGASSYAQFLGSYSYDAYNNLTGGTVNTILDIENGTHVYTLSGLSLPALTIVNWVRTGAETTAKNTIFAGDDYISGSALGDRLRGYGGNDTLAGGAGNDTLDGGTGFNYIDGGSGLDTVTRNASRAASFLISSGGSIYVGTSTGYDRAVDVEYIRFTDQTVATANATAFDGLSYLAANPDLVAAFGVNTNAALNHYLSNGYREGRSAGFNAVGYLAANPDLVAAFGTDTTAATQHYIVNGRNEGRTTSFNASAYLARYADLRAAFGSDQTAATMHYIIAGYREGRSAAPLSTTTTRAADALPWDSASGTLAAAGL